MDCISVFSGLIMLDSSMKSFSLEFGFIGSVLFFCFPGYSWLHQNFHSVLIASERSEDRNKIVGLLCYTWIVWGRWHVHWLSKLRYDSGICILHQHIKLYYGVLSYRNLWELILCSEYITDEVLYGDQNLLEWLREMNSLSMAYNWFIFAHGTGFYRNTGALLWNHETIVEGLVWDLIYQECNILDNGLLRVGSQVRHGHPYLWYR